MSITDELRRWAYSTFAHTIFSNLEKKVDEIADRIDAEHRSALEKVAAMVDEHDAGWTGCRSCRAHKRGGVVECQVHGNILRLDRLERRVSAIERKLNHRGDR